jgi:UDP-N-acetylmuramate--alanine ligase
MAKHYHFIGIGGMGMGPLASLSLDAGHDVSGSDLKESAITRQLRDRGARIEIGHSAGHLGNPDYVIYSSAVTSDNPEMAAAQSKNIPLLRRAQLLSELAETKTSITVAGAHGKTTTTAMIAYLLVKAGLKPTTLIGGVLNGRQAYNANLGQGPYLVTEVDESDGSFLYFHPRYSVITNIDFEHVDYYQNWDNILAAYRQFIGQTQPSGCVFACGDDDKLTALLKDSPLRQVRFGLGRDNDISAENIVYEDFSVSFDCVHKEAGSGRVCLKIPGRHNVLNALAAVAVGLELKLDFGLLKEGLGEYQGVQRRFQLKGKAGDILVVDDYGHHPTEIKAVLQTARAFGRRVVTVFQPHRYTRTKYLMKELAASLALSDYVIVTDIYAASEPPIPGVHARDLVELIRQSSKTTAVYCPQQDIVPHLLEITGPSDLVLTLGAGDIYHAGENFLEATKDQRTIKGQKA